MVVSVTVKLAETDTPEDPDNPDNPDDPDNPDNPDPMENPFTDVSETDYFYDAVLWAVKEGVTNGTSETKFSPNDPCTRAQVVTFLWRAFGSPANDSDDNPFTDIVADGYYFDAVVWAVNRGITKGTSATTFSPNASCTRAQVVTFLWRTAGEPAAEAGTEIVFTDIQTDTYYYEAVLWAVANGVTNGANATTFNPSGTCTRAQIVTFLYRALGK